MRNHHPAYGFIKKEWAARKWILITLALVMLLMTAFSAGQLDPDPLSLGIFSLLGFLTLGITFFSRDEYDPARSFIYQLPISRRRLLALKLRALAGQIAALLLILLAWVAVMSIASALSTDSYHHARIFNSLDRIMIFVALIAASSLALALLAAIVSLHIRSVIVALVLTPALAMPIAFLIVLPHFIRNNDAYSQGRLVGNSVRLFFPMVSSIILTLPDLGWIVLKLAIVTLLLGGWLFFVFCRTRIRELNPTPRALLVFLFGIAAVEVIYTLFYTGWRDLAWLVFGI